MTELTETETQKMNTGRMLRAESSALLPLLESKQALLVGKIVQLFKSGDYEKLTGAAAELSTVWDMRTEITRKIKEAAYLEAKMMSEDTRSSR